MMPSSNFRKDTQGMEWWKASLLVQLRTGHMPLQAYLHSIGKADSPVCPKCKKGDKTVGNYLTACKMFTGQRGCMERHMRRAAKSVNILLTNTKAFLSLFQYIHDTRRFQGSTQSS